MRLARGVTRASRRALVVYLLAIVAPTIVLLFFGLETIRQQRRDVVRLSEANRVLAERAVSDALEERTSALASACLRDEQLTAAVEARPWFPPGRARLARLALEEVARRHVVARHLFLVADGEVRLPRVGPAWPQPFESSVPAADVLTADRVRAAFRGAERLEAAGRFSDALAEYGRVRAATPSETLAAAALARTARCLDRLGRQADAISVYTELAVRFHGAYDLAGRPHALDAGLELVRLEQGRAVPSAILLHSLRADLVGGAWDVSPDEAEYFLRGLGGGDLAAAGPGYPHYLLAARALSESLKPGALVNDGGVHALAVLARPLPRQFYYLSRGDDLVVALEVNLDRVSGDLLAATARDLHADPSVRLAAAGHGGTHFRNTFPFWEVRAAPSADAVRSGLPAGVVVTGTLLVLCVLLLSVALLLRDMTRQAATNQLRADLVGGVSHDLKTPLAVIKLYGETLAADPDADRESRRSHYDVIVQESERLATLIDRVLDFSRAERGAREYRLRAGSLDDVVSQTLERYRWYLGSLGFSIDHRSDPDVPLTRFDESAVSQAVLNLIDNAVKYSDDEKYLAVRVLRRGDEAAIEVEDHGIGIAADDRGRVFARFSRASRPAARGSHGLGLYLVRHMADAHGARVELESTPGRGSLFRLLFPSYSPADDSPSE